MLRRVAQSVASEVSFSGGQALQRVRLQVISLNNPESRTNEPPKQDELDSGGQSGGLLDNDLIEYYQLLADKGDVQAQVLVQGKVEEVLLLSRLA